MPQDGSITATRVMDHKACPDALELYELAAGTISEAEGAKLRGHIGVCAACRVAVAELASSGAATRGEGDRPRYELRRLLATGGMGEVFLARDRVLGRDVAIKLHHEETSSPDALARSRRRLLREAKALASLAHPNVVAVYDQGVLDGRAFLAMEYVRGRTLRQWIAEEKPDLERNVQVLLQAGRGLLAAHEIGVVHRDFKPDNVLVGDDGRARVTDFGLARTTIDPDRSSGRSALASPNPQITIDGAVSGTPAYMAPEQLAGILADTRSDQYAFCVTAYEALHGARPGSRPNETAKIDRRLRRIDKALERGLSADPADRHASMGDLLADLQAGVAPDPDTRRLRWILLGVVPLLALTVGAFGMHRRAAPTPVPPELHSPCRGVNHVCPSPLVCRYGAGNACGVNGAPGVCGWPVDVAGDRCGPGGPAVCGCDGVTYKDACEAHAAGISIGVNGGPCSPCLNGAACADVTVNGKITPAFCRAAGGRCGGAGVCLPRPTTCSEGPAPACGCDGRTYLNACQARRGGTDVREGPCQ